MTDKYELVQQYLLEMEMPITHMDPEEEIVVVENEEDGIKNLVIDCEDPILILEQAIMPVPNNPGDLFKRLLVLNRELVHGAFVLDEDAVNVIFRDTLQLENLDRNELEGSIRALELAMAEYGPELLSYLDR